MSVENELDNALDLDASEADYNEKDLLQNDEDDFESEDTLNEDEDEDEDEDLGEFEEDDLDSESEDEAEATKMPMKTKVLLGGLTVLGISLVGFVASHKLGLIGGTQVIPPQAQAPEIGVEHGKADDAVNLNNITQSTAKALDDSPVQPKATVDAVSKVPALVEFQDKDFSSELGVATSVADNNFKLEVEGYVEDKLSVEMKAVKAELSNANALLEKKLATTDAAQKSNRGKLNKVAKKVSGLSTEVAEIKSVIGSGLDVDLTGLASKDELGQAIKQIEGLSQTVSSIKESVKSARLTKDQKAVLLDGRKRLEAFKIVNSTSDGTMSVVVTPSKRVQVYFSGERFITRNGGRMTVTSVEDNGHVLLVGSKYFIDEVYVAPKKKVVKASKPKKTTPVATPVKLKSERIASDNFGRQVVASGKVKALGWSLNGSYTDGYLVQNPSGKWLTVKVGTKIEGLGLIEGLDKKGNLIVGQNFIEKAKD